MTRFIVNPSRLGGGKVTVPGDKSISHRAVMFGAIADGRTEVRGFLDGEDCLATVAAMAAMGVTVSRPSATELVIEGVGRDGLAAPAADLDLGNSGTAMRLMTGLLAGQAFDSTLTGDASLSSRPMGRVIRPIEAMGGQIASRDGRPPLRVSGGRRLHGIEYALPVASAQVKSAVLLAGLYAEGSTVVTEPAITRDHTERMLRAMGVSVTGRDGRIGLTGGQRLTGTDVSVPADLSSATFVMLAVLLAEDADVLITNVGVNPTRTGVIAILRGMGADIRLERERTLGDEPVADIRVRSGQLEGGAVDPDLVSLAIDEFPALFVAAAAARGETTFSGLAELRVKESDRIAAMASGLRALGVEVRETPDGAIVTGGTFRGGVLDSHGDHRVAMSLALAGTVAEGPVTVNDVAPVDTSFPGFAELMRSLGADIAVEDA
ncbi:MAG: 3-phosphoshikimate 1-carboxyvinyltransferase [Woeseiaceae bacterium]|nr:3-phosphoshikimate 1-carboxyvinyltransferase [Woeseiaceae bacterium]